MRSPSSFLPLLSSVLPHRRAAGAPRQAREREGCGGSVAEERGPAPDGRFFRALADSVADGAYFVDRDRRILFWNGAAERITGFRAGDMLGRACCDTGSRHVDEDGKLLCDAGCPLTAAMSGGAPREARLFVRHRNGHRLPVKVRTAPVLGEAGEVLGAVEVFTDDSALTRAAERIAELERLAMLDPLTGLPNRRYIEAAVEMHIQEARRLGVTSGVLMIDVDHFKGVNDAHGHEAGDAVLKTVAATLAANMRPFDVVGRWGGEEFVALVRSVDDRELARVSERLRGLVEASSHAALGEDERVTVSIGARILTGRESPAEVVRAADRLMYEGKRSGRNRVVVG